MTSILFAGDFCPTKRVSSLFEKNDFNTVLSSIKPYFDSVDYSILNLECPIATSGQIPIEKTGPNLKSNEKALLAVKYLGVNCVGLANNHIMDYGDDGLRETIAKLKTFGIDYVGAGNNFSEASVPLIKNIGDKSVAIINCCEQEFSIASENSAGCNPIDCINQYKSIKNCKDTSDIVIVFIHGGIEHCQYPTPRMKKQYQFYIEAGADVVINCHQHCYSGYEIYNGKPIFYGIGNFCFDRGIKNEKWNNGYLIKLLFDDKINFELIPYEQCGQLPQVKPIENKDHFCDILNKLNSIIADEQLLRKSISDYVNETQKEFEYAFCPYSNKYLAKLFVHHLIPEFRSSSRWRIILNAIRCESHRDRLLLFLNNKV